MDAGGCDGCLSNAPQGRILQVLTGIWVFGALPVSAGAARRAFVEEPRAFGAQGGKLGDKLFGWALQLLPRRRSHFDGTTLGKSRHLFFPPPLRPASRSTRMWLSPALHRSRAVSKCLRETFAVRASGVEHSPSAIGANNVSVRMLRREEDVPQMASLFVDTSEEIAPADREALRKRVATSGIRSLSNKNQAAAEVHAYNRRTRIDLMQRELEFLALAGSVDRSSDFPTREQLQEASANVGSTMQETAQRSPKLQKRRRLRQWMMLMADRLVETAAGFERKLVGGAMLKVCVPDALLPPPFPSNGPYRAYISGLAVVEGARRCGVATSLIKAAERTARLWGFDEVWLHVNVDNMGALAFYQNLGYERISKESRFFSGRRILLKRDITNLDQ
eukprot:gnl/TRDRNA2_/TRDRNA2_153413_c0_seq3.p1 gnl/TRDRNA2_/TRDRNA2_153413_c0~~gnl/TRDRNA2_/TRDRNA2_153413_c0_seq3.p1  ORF type:complete len:391 (-),score=61.69 gnl/TRDRNA2_/TRDRNA2_153413_c0_seq3:97-1269(-)